MASTPQCLTKAENPEPSRPNRQWIAQVQEVDIIPYGYRVLVEIRPALGNCPAAMLRAHTYQGDCYVDDFKSAGPWTIGVNGIRQIIRDLERQLGQFNYLIGARLTGASELPRIGRAKVRHAHRF
jgi:hypothetical protein